jgi:hypothetical protein
VTFRRCAAASPSLAQVRREKINLDQSTRLLQLVPSEKPSVKKCASILETLL